MFKVAMLSKWHVHAAGYANEFNKIPGCAVAYVWDEDVARGEKWAQDLGVPFVADLDELLAKKDFDGVIVDTPTTMHDVVIPKAARAGKHIFTEKALSTTVAGCDAIIPVVRDSGVKFCISFPWRTVPAYAYVQEALAEGKLGDVSLLRVRNGHNGALAGWLPPYWFDKNLTGGGALMDLGCHPVYMANWMLGKAENIHAVMTYQTGRDLEDTAACMVTYGGGKTAAMLETSLITPHSPNTVEIYGEKGSIHCFGNTIQAKYDGYEGWTRPDRLPATVSPLQQWVNGVTKGDAIPFDLDAARELTVVLAAAYQSSETQSVIRL